MRYLLFALLASALLYAAGCSKCSELPEDRIMPYKGKDVSEIIKQDKAVNMRADYDYAWFYKGVEPNRNGTSTYHFEFSYTRKGCDLFSKNIYMTTDKKGIVEDITVKSGKGLEGKPTN